MKKTPNNKLNTKSYWHNELVAPTTYRVDDIENIPNDLCGILKNGDIVVEKADGEEFTYVVNVINGNTISLVYVDGDWVKQVIYADGELDETTETAVGGITEQQVKDLIEADKDIINQIEIEYDEDNDLTTFVFPKGVIPVCLYFNEYADEEDLYFDYLNNKLYSFSRDLSEDTSIDFNNNSLTLYISGDLTNDKVNCLLYLNESGVGNGFLYGFEIAWQNVLKPQPNGTKLYNHSIKFANNVECIAVSTLSTPITDYNDLSGFLGQCLSIKDLSNMSILLFDIDTDILVYASDPTSQFADLVDYQTIIDVVTPF